MDRDRSLAHTPLMPSPMAKTHSVQNQDIAGVRPCESCTSRHLSFCAPLANSEQQKLADILVVQNIDASAPIFSEGEQAQAMFNITSGCVRIYRLLGDGRRQITGFLFPGDYLGLAREQNYVYSAEAITEVRLCRFERKAMQQVIKDIPKLERELLGRASNELAVAQDQMLLLGRKNAKEKIASFLLQLSTRAKRWGNSGNPFELPMSRLDIADFLGLTTETVSRTFTQLRKDKMIELLPDNYVRLTNLESLAEITEGFGEE